MDSFALLNASITLSKLMPESALMPRVALSVSAASALSGSAMLILPPSMALVSELSEE